MSPDTKDNNTGGKKPLTWFFTALVAILVLVLFHFLGNATDVRLFGRSVFGWMILRWGDSTVSLGTYSHGWLIPLVSIAIVWFRWKDLLAADKRVCWRGLWVVVLALILHLAGVRAQQPRISLLGFILLIWGIPLFLQGWGVARLLIFPCAYLVFCIPLNFLDELSFHLRIIVTATSTILLNGLGIEAERMGTAIFSAAGGGFSLDVADPCSGIRSLLAITALAAAYAYFSQTRLWKQWVLFLLSIPLAVISNIARVLAIGVIAHFRGQEAALGFYHNYSGYVVMIIVVLLLAWVGDLLNRLKVDKVPAGQP